MVSSVAYLFQNFVIMFRYFSILKLSKNFPNQLHVDFCPRKVHQGPCLKRLFNNIYAKDCINEYLQILRSVDGPRKVFARLLRKNCIVVCNVPLGHFLMDNAETDCISEKGEGRDLRFKQLQKRFCRYCIKHYLKKMSDFYPFKVFNNE